MKVLVAIKVQDYLITLFLFCSKLNINHSFVDGDVTLIPRKQNYNRFFPAPELKD